MADILAWLQASKIPVTEYLEWQTRTSAGGFHPVGVMVHHTGSKDSSIRTIVHGRRGLSGPLSHLFIEQIPVPKVWLISQGNANHAGQGSADQLERVKQGRTPLPVPPPLSPEEPERITGNPWFWGIEIEGPEILPASYKLAVRCVAAILQGNGWSTAHVISHKEWTYPRKVDPAFSMTTFRKDVTTEMGVEVYPPRTRKDMRRDLADPQGVPDWAPWDEYVAAGGSGRPESGPWPVRRYDLAWYYDKFVRPLQEHAAHLEESRLRLFQIVTELQERVAELEAHIVDRPGDSITFGQAVTFQPIGGP